MGVLKGSPSSPEGQGRGQTQGDEMIIKNKLEKNLSDPNVNEEINSTHKNSFLISFHGCGLLFLILMSNWRNL